MKGVEMTLDEGKKKIENYVNSEFEKVRKKIMDCLETSVDLALSIISKIRDTISDIIEKFNFGCDFTDIRNYLIDTIVKKIKEWGVRYDIAELIDNTNRVIVACPTNIPVENIGKHGVLPGVIDNLKLMGEIPENQRFKNVKVSPSFFR